MELEKYFVYYCWDFFIIPWNRKVFTDLVIVLTVCFLSDKTRGNITNIYINALYYTEFSFTFMMRIISSILFILSLYHINESKREKGVHAVSTFFIFISLHKCSRPRYHHPRSSFTMIAFHIKRSISLSNGHLTTSIIKLCHIRDVITLIWSILLHSLSNIFTIHKRQKWVIKGL